MATDLTQSELDSLRNSVQFGRECKLDVFDSDLNGIDLSALRIKFSIKKTGVMTPNMADIRVYNLADSTATLIRKQFKKVVLQAGYAGNIGTIFQGNIQQVIIGRESSTDTFIDIVAMDGGFAYNYAVVNGTLAAGASLEDQVSAAIGSMNSKGVTAGYSDLNTTEKLPRGKVMFSPSKNVLKDIMDSSDRDWSIQDGKVNILRRKTYLPGEIVYLSSKTGMIGTPQQTNIGVNLKCLLNPNLKVTGRVQIDNRSVARFKINIGEKPGPENYEPPQNADGVYYLFVVEHLGDTRGIEWYSNLVCLNISVTSNPLNSVQADYG